MRRISISGLTRVSSGSVVIANETGASLQIFIGDSEGGLVEVGAIAADDAARVDSGGIHVWALGIGQVVVG